MKIHKVIVKNKKRVTLDFFNWFKKHNSQLKKSKSITRRLPFFAVVMSNENVMKERLSACIQNVNEMYFDENHTRVSRTTHRVGWNEYYIFNTNAYQRPMTKEFLDRCFATLFPTCVLCSQSIVKIETEVRLGCGKDLRSHDFHHDCIIRHWLLYPETFGMCPTHTDELLTATHILTGSKLIADALEQIRTMSRQRCALKLLRKRLYADVLTSIGQCFSYSEITEDRFLQLRALFEAFRKRVATQQQAEDTVMKIEEE
jgi:hypothetical protein